MRRWTPEERERQSQLIKQWKPWEQSTGPKTSPGKARSSRNADKPNSFNRRLQDLQELVRQLKKESAKIFRKDQKL